MFHTYTRRRNVVRTIAFLVVIFLGLELAFQGADQTVGYAEPNPDWLPEAWTANPLLTLYVGVLTIQFVDLIVSSVVYMKHSSSTYVRRFIALQLFGALVATAAYLTAVYVEARWPFTFLVSFGVMMAFVLSDQFLKPLQPTKQEGLPNER
ncbi:hypothetical protein [Exiguobacterium alkaliphilum]|uniref:hypothetical protein n=1 Tax=Exiguobacterium alkaliphilum TaxID=1428684 RepID=UPI00403AB5D0